MKLKTFILAGAFLFSGRLWTSYPVFDATNNVLATLQKSMDSAFQQIQKMDMQTLINQAKLDYAEQIQIYNECVKQYEECVRIYDKAVQTYNWIDRNIGQARNIMTFLSCDFSNPQNIRRLGSLVHSTLSQPAVATNKNYNQSVLRASDQYIADSVAQEMADRGIDRQKYAQASAKVADTCDSMSQTMLTQLQTKDQVLESRVRSGSADLMQITHANEQGTMFIAEEMARVNSNVSSINRTVSRQEQAYGETEMNRAQESAVATKIEKEAIERGNSYTRQQDSRKRINNVFQDCRVF